ncbi:MAG TPA: hypothetical protein VF538_15275 [Pyrinomonadaceae bacterium]
MDTVIGLVTGSGLILFFALYPGNGIYNSRQIVTTVVLFMLVTVNFVILLNLFTWMGVKLKLTVLITVNIIYAAWSTFGVVKIKELQLPLIVICSVLVALNVLISTLTRKKMLP